ncbi:MAG TPA: NAD(P)/FAD-dependent oxidoreductase [Acidimicrobiales bacterium]|nr:NAD(P)/FAD-dependent oxidoreductase [Acidimicrobiales bacterium]
MTRETADVVVIGLGPGGEEVAGRLAEAGLEVVGIERELLGGECPYWGCVPTKMMIRGGNLLAEARRVSGMSGTTTVAPDWAPVAHRIRAEATDSWDDQVAVERFVGKGGRFIRGAARLAAPGRVVVGDVEIEASRGIVIATGTVPVIPPVPGLGDLPYWTNRDAIKTEEVPESLLVLGGGAIGLELAQVFARFGSRVTVVEGLDRLVPMEEPEASEMIAKVFEAEGINVRTGNSVVAARRDAARLVLETADGSQVTGERLLVATGRRTALGPLGLETVGLDASARWVDVDTHMRAAPGIWAVGDVTGKGLFTHMAMYQAGIAVADILGRPSHAADYRAVPRVTFTDPEIGSVGLSTAAATETGLRVRTGWASLPSSARGWIHKAGNEGFIKLVEDADAGLLVGATSAGPAGGEVLGLLSLAVHARVPTAELAAMIYAYPTFHRAIEAALSDLRDKSV